ncbi:B12-binding domain-containing radical SAM protein [Thermovenabulum sp.]|uniref:B12-binding domain-containing radical SAM protein n=1 Tax=Thermovenabulum sp. TaxID=3100335 RepID=UPI003C7A9F53
MRVVLVGINAKYIHTNLAIRNLKAYYEKNFKEEGIKIDLLEATINDFLDDVLERIVEFNPSVVGFSLYIWNLNQVLYLAENLKKVLPEVMVIFGGPEASYDIKGLLSRDYVDLIVIGEGEDTFSKLIVALKKGEKIEELKGIAFKDEKGIKINRTEENVDMNLVPMSYEEELDFQNRIVYYETSRGCPFNCTFCLSSLEKNVRVADLKKVEEDLRILAGKKAKIIKFVDRSFNYNIKRAIEILDIFRRIEGDTVFHCELNPELVSQEFVDRLRGLENRLHFELGIQTTTPEALKEVKRTKDVEKALKGVKLLKEKGVPVHVDLIAGLPYDTFESFKEAFNKVYNLKPDELQLGFLKLLKGTAIRERAQSYGIAFRSQPPYEILYNKWMSYKELTILKGIAKLIDKFYNSHRFENSLSYFERNFDTPFDFYLELYGFLKEENFFFKENSLESLYEKLYFFAEKLNLNLPYIKELLRYDYLLFGGKGKFPSYIDYDQDQKEIAKNFLKNKDRLIKIFENRYTLQEIMKHIKIGYFTFDVPFLEKKENMVLVFDAEGKKEILKIYI